MHRLLRTTFCLLSCFTFPACAAQVQEAEAASANIIILLLVDGMGWRDTSVQFGEEQAYWNDSSKRQNSAGVPERAGRLEVMASLFFDRLERADAAFPIDKATGEAVDISDPIEAAGR